MHVLRRGPDELQVGLHPARAVVLADRDEVRSTLTALSRPGAPAEERAPHPGVLGMLDDAGLVTDLERLLPLLPGTSEQGDSAGSRAGDVAAVALRRHDPEAVLGRRATRAVEVVPAGGAPAAALAQRVRDLLDAAGCTLEAAGGTGGPVGVAAPERGATPPEPGFGVLVALGEPRRERVDRWMREQTPHVVLRLTEGDALLGPLVVPGATACLRCVDAHLTDVDPVWPLLVVQHADACATPRDDAVPEPCDPVLATLAAAWTARDVLTHLEGGDPSTLSTTVRLGPVLRSLETQTWSRHPGCGCTWA